MLIQPVEGVQTKDPEKKMIVTGCGALNLDVIYQVEDMGTLASQGFPLAPGRECVLDHTSAKRLLSFLKAEGTLLGKSGGGSAANTICALSQMGHKCFFIGSVGRDEEGEFLIESMGQVDCSLIERSGKSSLCIIVMDSFSHDRALAVVPGTISIKTDSPKMKTILKNSRLFHLSSISLEQGPMIQATLAASCPQDCIVSFDPGEIYAERGYEAIKDILKKTWLLSASDLEFEAIFGKRSVMEVLSKGLFGQEIKATKKAFPKFFREMPPPVVARKSGAKGALIASRSSIFKCPARKVEHIVDNTGAGDAFNAGLLNAVLKGKDPKEALEEGVSLAAYSLMFPGRSWIEHLDEFIILP